MDALRSGRGRNPILQECARRLWLYQSLQQFDIKYSLGNEMWENIANHLCRAHISKKHHVTALKLLIKYDIPVVPPALTLLSDLPVPLFSRSGHGITHPESGPQADKREGRGDGEE